MFAIMKEGDDVICISEAFPEWKTTDEDKSRIGTTPAHHPKKGEIITIDEVLGDFIRFDKYDIPESFNWWHHSRFRKVEDADCEESIDAVVHKNVELFKSLRTLHRKHIPNPNEVIP